MPALAQCRGLNQPLTTGFAGEIHAYAQPEGAFYAETYASKWPVTFKSALERLGVFLSFDRYHNRRLLRFASRRHERELNVLKSSI